MMSPLMKPKRHDQLAADATSGFALVVAIWAIGILALLFVAYIAAARHRTIEAQSVLQRMRAEMASRTGVNLAIFDLLSNMPGQQPRRARFARDGSSASCRLDDGSTIFVQVMDEGGKVDINTASPELIALLLRGLYQRAPKGRELAGRILARRAANSPLPGTSPGAKAGNDPSAGVFKTALELDQIEGMDSDDFRSLLPFVTVHSKSPGIDPQVAPLPLLQLLASRGSSESSRQRLEKEVPPEYVATSLATTFLINALAVMPSGARHLRTAVTELSVEVRGGYRIHEWREGPLESHLAAPVLDDNQSC
jgi:general secretion pathway protein K